jgi:CP family cyanate transporter-like MFS transporter
VPRRSLLLVLGIVALALNLRPTAVSVGPVLEEVRRAFSASPTAVGFLTSLPALAFAGFGALTPLAARLLGLHRLTFLALLAVAGGLAGRAVTSSFLVFAALTAVALGGMAAANVVLPSLVKLHFPDRVGSMSAAYTTALAIGLTLASALTVPVAELGGSWRWGLGVWAVVAGLAALPWITLVRHDARARASRRGISVRQVARTRLGWAMATAFGLQSLQAYTVFGWLPQIYRDAGFSPATAGLLLGVVTGLSIPISAWVPQAAARRSDQTRLLLGLVACYPAGYAGLILAPVAGAWVWAVLIGIGTGVFPLILTQINLRARTADGTAALSGFTQSVGYLIAAAGPAVVGVLYDATGGWTWPLLLLIALTGVLAVVAAATTRPGVLEDQLTA